MSSHYISGVCGFVGSHLAKRLIKEGHKVYGMDNLDCGYMANIDELRSEGISVLLVEQNARLSLSRSDRGYIFSNGKVVHAGDAKSILSDPNIGDYFLGLHQ